MVGQFKVFIISAEMCCYCAWRAHDLAINMLVWLRLSNPTQSSVLWKYFILIPRSSSSQQLQQSSICRRSFQTRWCWRSSRTCWSRTCAVQHVCASASVSWPMTPSSGETPLDHHLCCYLLCSFVCVCLINALMILSYKYFIQYLVQMRAVTITVP